MAFLSPTYIYVYLSAICYALLPCFPGHALLFFCLTLVDHIESQEPLVIIAPINQPVEEWGPDEEEGDDDDWEK